MRKGNLYKVKDRYQEEKWTGIYLGMKEIFNASGMTGRIIHHLFLINGEQREFNHRILEKIEEVKEGV